jgi:hypothetical protein
MHIIFLSATKMTTESVGVLGHRAQFEQEQNENNKKQQKTIVYLVAFLYCAEFINLPAPDERDD